MTTSAVLGGASASAHEGPRRRIQIGRTFLHPVLDYAAIGGGMSLLATAFLLWGPLVWPRVVAGAFGSFQASLPALLLIASGAHFAASTVRLYTKPGAFQEFPFLTRGLPLVTLALLTLSIAFAAPLGPHLQSLYLTWSPFHYAAQAYGLALMYCYRSGCALSEGDRWLLRSSCLAPFLGVFISAPGIGLAWLLPESALGVAAVTAARTNVAGVLGIASFLLPAYWLVRVARAGGAPVPLISPLIVVSNAVWWVFLPTLGAVSVAAVAHAVQYLLIVIVFHVRDQRAARPDGRGWAYHVVWFYGACVLLSYLLFDVWPYAYVGLGFGLAESMLLVVAVINVHHFVVDAYIWRLRRGGNRRIVEAAA